MASRIKSSFCLCALIVQSSFVIAANVDINNIPLAEKIKSGKPLSANKLSQKNTRLAQQNTNNSYEGIPFTEDMIPEEMNKQRPGQDNINDFKNKLKQNHTNALERAQRNRDKLMQMKDQRGDMREQMRSDRQDFRQQAQEQRGDMREQMQSDRQDFRQHMQEQRGDMREQMQGDRQEFKQQMQEQRSDMRERMQNDRQSFRQQTHERRSGVRDQLQSDRQDFRQQAQEQRANTRENWQNRKHNLMQRTNDGRARPQNNIDNRRNHSGHKAVRSKNGSNVSRPKQNRSNFVPQGRQPHTLPLREKSSKLRKVNKNKARV